jgi:hypothetical protein
MDGPTDSNVRVKRELSDPQSAVKEMVTISLPHTVANTLLLLDLS